MKHDKNKKNNNPSSTGNLDEGLNETTRINFTDSISTAASKETLKKKK